ncbi:MAG: LysR family transcriptional regulator [Lachnospiraceae bacterium]|nr:LysR family transcriptional regulator [Lachnospiraceae bacterium]
MNLKQLEAFVMIANNKSFSLTAKKLYLTQPTVSAYISKLEYELGEKLFYRTTKEVTLTEAGKKIYIYAKDIIELAEKIENAFKGSSEEGTRRMVISASSIPGTYLLPGILAEFSRTYPNVEMRVQESDSIGVMNDIREHRADLGFVGTATKDREISFMPFCKDELVLITPNNDRYRELKEKKLNLTWIEQEPWIMREDGSGTYKETLHVFEEMGIHSDQLHILARFNNTGAILLSVAQGSGITIVSRLAAQSAVDRGDVLDHPLGANGSYRWISIATSSTTPLTDTSRDMIKLVKKMYNC